MPGNFRSPDFTGACGDCDLVVSAKGESAGGMVKNQNRKKHLLFRFPADTLQQSAGMAVRAGEASPWQETN